MGVTIATWNVNSIKARLPVVLEWLRTAKPDVALLQETKTTDDTFPLMELEELGYNIALHGQKSYNGVAILSKSPIEDVQRGLPGEESDEQARYIEAIVNPQGKAIRVASIYVPNGQDLKSEKFPYKMRFFDRLQIHFQQRLAWEELFVAGGDYNVAPEEIDVYNVKHLDGSIGFHPEERAKMRALMNLGFYDAFRVKNPDHQAFSWWDYRAGSWQSDKGMRIDHLLLSPQAIDHTTACTIDKTPRSAEKASDHTPVICELAL